MMNIKNRKIVYLSVAIVLSVAAAVSGFVAYQQLVTASEIPISIIDFSVQLPENNVVMKKGETRVITADVLAPREKPLNIKVGIVEADKESVFEITGRQILPEGILATVDKASVSLPAEATKGIAKRGQLTITLTTLPETKAGFYSLSIVAFSDTLDTGKASASGAYLTVEVQN